MSPNYCRQIRIQSEIFPLFRGFRFTTTGENLPSSQKLWFIEKNLLPIKQKKPHLKRIKTRQSRRTFVDTTFRAISSPNTLRSLNAHKRRIKYAHFRSWYG